MLGLDRNGAHIHKGDYVWVSGRGKCLAIGKNPRGVGFMECGHKALNIAMCTAKPRKCFRLVFEPGNKTYYEIIEGLR